MSYQNPPPPFITSSLQQDASSKLHMPPKVCMSVAQRLYEAGKITYMRTDSVELSQEVKQSIKEHIVSEFGEEYYTNRHFKSKSKSSQEAHEAIRPVHIEEKQLYGEFFESNDRKLYNLIWKRAVASQMARVRKKIHTIEISISNRSEKFNTVFEEIMFRGFLKLYNKQINDTLQLDKFKIGNECCYDNITSTEKYTQPPTRYTEASLIKDLEKKGIGRPSTFSNIISKIQDRKYVVKETRNGIEKKSNILVLKDNSIKIKTKKIKSKSEKNKLFITDTGKLVTEFLIGYFEHIMDYSFTEKIESKLDDIATGKLQWYNVVGNVYNIFHPIVLKLSDSNGVKKTKHLLGKYENINIYKYVAKYGPVIQRGEYNTPEYKIYGIKKNIEDITLEDAITLFSYPKHLGKYEGSKIVLKNGSYGLYLTYNKINYSLKEKKNITLEEAISIIKNSKKKIIHTFGNIQVLNGPYGPYVKKGKKTKAVPKNMNIGKLTLEKCQKILSK